MKDNKQYLASEEAKARDEWKSADADGRYRKSGIIYWNHEPGKNYFMANGAGDTDMKTDILMSEISKLIVNNKPRVVELLNQNGVQTSSGISTNSLSDKVGESLYGNPQFAKAIAAELVQSGSKLNADGTKATFTELTGTLSDAAKNVNNLIRTIFGGINKNKNRGKQSTEVLKDNVDAVKKINGAGIGAAGYILIALGVSAAIGLTIYLAKK